jgi:hypothetical protein
MIQEFQGSSRRFELQTAKKLAQKGLKGTANNAIPWIPDGREN